jgi:hypothetical protein
VTATLGVDTWSPAWYLDPEGEQAAELNAQASYGAGRGKLLPQPVDGHRIGWFPREGLLYAEGHPGDDGLADADALVERLSCLEISMQAEGVPVPVGERVWYPSDAVSPFCDRSEGFAGVRRLDSTINVPVASPTVGAAVLSGVAAVVRDLPRVKPQVIWEVGGRRVQTVYLRGYSGKRVLGRVYDKGAESGMAERATLVRLEDQRRWSRDARRDVAELGRGYVRSKLHERFVGLWKATKGVTVAGPIVLAEKLQALVEADEITPTQAARIAGDVVMELVQHDGARRPSRATRYRRQAVRRELGLVLADGVLEEVEVDLHDVLTEALDTATWGAQG